MNFRILSTVVFLFLLVASCKKEGGGGVLTPQDDKSYISAQFNGRTIRFKLVPTANQKGAAIGYESGYYILMAVGLVNFSEEFNDIIQIGIASQNKIRKGTYVEDFTGDYNADQLLISFENRNGIEYESSEYQHDNPVKLTISHLDDKRMDGTFSGSIFKDGDSRKEEMKITNGSFRLYYEIYE